MSTEIIKSYFKAFNEGNTKAMLALLHAEVEHEINQGKVEIGLETFTRFMKHMDTCYKEELKDIVFFAGETSSRVAAEYDVHGTYLQTDGSLPAAHGQKYVIRAGSFFEIVDQKIKRVTTYYNLPKWIEMVK